MKPTTVIEALTESLLLLRCQAIEGLTLAQLAVKLSLPVPEHPLQRKGWIGKMIELALGAEAGTRAVPDFETLGIELKTLPIGKNNTPQESTFLTSISLLTLHEQSWTQSSCYLKLRRILWMPVEAEQKIPFLERRIGQGFIWSPSEVQSLILKSDFLELTGLIRSGKLEQISAHRGVYLQIRPKAADSKASCQAHDEHGHRIQTLPRGFYLRRSFTELIWRERQHLNNGGACSTR